MNKANPAYMATQTFGTRWLGNLPANWNVCRLKNLAETIVSNVDKHTKEEEVPVRLCNYVDVYKNDKINLQIPFMVATASREELKKFRLKQYDVLITKDSETWNDIAVPALVTETATDLISGYHLAILRPKAGMNGKYLFWSLQSKQFTYQFHVEAKGVTRFGLSHNGIRSVLLPFPPPEQQAAIVRYLDKAEQQIQAYISAKEKLIALLEEQRQTIIHQAVTRGLDPSVKLKPSGVEWLGDVPEHWKIRRIKTLAKAKIGLTYSPQDISESAEGTLVLRASNIRDRKVIDADNVYVQSAVPQELILKIGDILVCSRSGSRSLIGKNARIGPESAGSTFGAFMTILRGQSNDYLHQLLNSQLFDQQSGMFMTSTINQLTLEMINNMKVPIPPPDDQQNILIHLRETTSKADLTINQTRRQIELMQEYRTRLIADVVTGKLDVR